MDEIAKSEKKRCFAASIFFFVDRNWNFWRVNKSLLFCNVKVIKWHENLTRQKKIAAMLMKQIIWLPRVPNHEVNFLLHEFIAKKLTHTQHMCMQATHERIHFKCITCESSYGKSSFFASDFIQMKPKIKVKYEIFMRFTIAICTGNWNGAYGTMLNTSCCVLVGSTLVALHGEWIGGK